MTAFQSRLLFRQPTDLVYRLKFGLIPLDRDTFAKHDDLKTPF